MAYDKITLNIAPAYIAPEIILKKGYNGFFSDMWSIGVCIYILITGMIPFN